MVRKTLFFLCVAMGLGSPGLKTALADGGSEQTVRFESGLYYTVEKGDTLWNIAEQVYDVPWVWTDLWQRNPHIANPNWIYPGERIRLFWREELEKMPGAEEGIEPEAGLRRRVPRYFLYPAIDSVGFIRKQAVTPWGTIFKVKEDKVMISEGDLVYIRAQEEATLKEGDYYTVFRTLEPLKEEGTEDLIGIQHRIVGVVRITEIEPAFSVGRVILSFRDMKVKDLIMPYEGRAPKIELVESKEGLEGRIIVSERRSLLIGDRAVVFIDQGSKDGVKVGQKYSVYYQEREDLGADGKESVLLPPVDFGEILILRTEETTATALVTMAQKAILPGAKTHTPPR
ncbi:MAG: LysM domain-containing protein [Thermodesulfobacteriota bacterium]|nr:LysM domain-containing protein [Thermodesulfobacteriota bacterium]